jgi:hypothetical protein
MQQPALQVGARILQISEHQTKLLFECEDDSTLDLTNVDPGNAVIVRGQEQYIRLSWDRVWVSLAFT